jgi:hypothetical protein
MYIYIIYESRRDEMTYNLELREYKINIDRCDSLSNNIM